MGCGSGVLKSQVKSNISLLSVYRKQHFLPYKTLQTKWNAEHIIEHITYYRKGLISENYYLFKKSVEKIGGGGRQSDAPTKLDQLPINRLESQVSKYSNDYFERPIVTGLLFGGLSTSSNFPIVPTLL